MLQGEVPIELFWKLIPYATAKNACHPCSVYLVRRAVEEMVKAAQSQEWELAAIKLASLLLILRYGVFDVFKENLWIADGEVMCKEIDYDRFDRCCKRI
jgi:hypothetical protein